MKHLLALSIVITSVIACNGSSTYINDVKAPKDSEYVISDNKNLNRENILKAHNKVRQQEGVQNLVWSDALKSYAEDWARYLKKNKQCGLIHRPSTGSHKQKYGENLFYLGPVKWSNGKVVQQKLSEQSVVNKWVSEKSNYDIASNTCKAGSVCSHYTQVMWKKSTQVGCAAVACSNQAQVVVCNYNPPGNFSGQRPF